MHQKSNLVLISKETYHENAHLDKHHHRRIGNFGCSGRLGFFNPRLGSYLFRIDTQLSRNVGISGYYTAPAQLQQAAEHKSACGWRVVKNDLDAPKAVHTVSGNSKHLAPTNLQLVC
ncbi:MAG: hypothetical protein PHG89_08610 [Gallionella sp.]|nr:hypothetical protein [Gallionella sp.]